MAETISMPKLGFDMSEGTLVRWVKQEGEDIAKGETIAEIETDKATVEVESSATGVVRKLLASQGEVVPVGAPIAIVGEVGESIEEPTAAKKAPAAPASREPARAQAAPSRPEPEATAATPAAPTAGEIKASPLARRLARESDVDLSGLTGSGPGGRIVRKDVEAAAAGPRATAAPAPAAAPRPQVVAVPGEDRNVKLPRLRQAIARRMAESKVTAPHFYVTHEYDVGSLLDFRRQLSGFVEQEAAPSVNDFIVRATALTLREYPSLNASFAGEELVLHGSVNVGIAVAVENGLLTVVCRNADQKPLTQISAEVKAMVARARAGKVRPDDIEGSTFSVSNLGMYDVENFIAILNPPEAAILAVGSAREVAVVDGGQIKAATRMKATISVDHRVSDGAEAARFLQSLAGFLENPARLFL